MTNALIEEMVRSARERARTLPPRDLPAHASKTSFIEALRGKSRLDVIAEFKRASPSLGDIAERHVEAQVLRYEGAGAAALSVLTEPSRFNGSLSDLGLAVRAVDVPVLMKDFVVDPAQVREAAYLGARAVLLIVRCLSHAELVELASLCTELGLTPLVECHTEVEVERALDISDAVLGVNNRDLESLEIDGSLAPRLLAGIPQTRVVVAESGYETPSEVAALRGLADAVLVGSALMKLDDPSDLIREMRA